MLISGNGVPLYKDDSNETICLSYPAEGPDVCSDVILIPISTGTTVQHLTVSTYGTSLTLCEVQVFAGIVIQ